MTSKASLSGPNLNLVRTHTREGKGEQRITGFCRTRKTEQHADIPCEEIQEGAPTQDQVNSILEYLGPSNAGSVIKDATGTSDALRKFKANESSFQRPITVDWNNGRAGT